MAERALEAMKDRAKSRTAFGKLLAEQDTVIASIAQSRMEIEQARYCLSVCVFEYMSVYPLCLSCMYMYLCVYVCMCVCVHVCICVHLCVR